MILCLNIAPYYQLNFTSDHIVSAREGNGVLKIKLISNPLHELIKKGIAGEVKTDNRESLAGIVEVVEREDGKVVVVFRLNPKEEPCIKK